MYTKFYTKKSDRKNIFIIIYEYTYMTELNKYVFLFYFILFNETSASHVLHCSNIRKLILNLLCCKVWFICYIFPTYFILANYWFELHHDFLTQEPKLLFFSISNVSNYTVICKKIHICNIFLKLKPFQQSFIIFQIIPKHF